MQKLTDKDVTLALSEDELAPQIEFTFALDRRQFLQTLGTRIARCGQLQQRFWTAAGGAQSRTWRS
jgi:hypothetical protein